ncbi:hypothetical protein B4144_3730 [Bacillus atrophaeus]|nr:hypothetical protein B4144_3730 [Bacillus atrophaeus]
MHLMLTYLYDFFDILKLPDKQIKNNLYYVESGSLPYIKT